MRLRLRGGVRENLTGGHVVPAQMSIDDQPQTSHLAQSCAKQSPPTGRLGQDCFVTFPPLHCMLHVAVQSRLIGLSCRSRRVGN